jgi:hypothetical protein|tara:strand:+ start:1102 stop:1641 length:540 start_codon:yes stop_codon:yes gene_type:complete
MKKILSIALALTLGLFGLAYAGYNVQEPDWGGSSMVHTDGSSIGHGDAGMAFSVTGIDSAATYYVTSAKNGRITKIFAALGTVLASGPSPVFTIFIDKESDAVGQFSRVSDLSNESLADLSQIVWADDGIATGTAGSQTFVVFAAKVTSSYISAGDVIAIVGDGGGVGGLDATFTIVIE